MSHPTGERRPIASRNLKALQRLAERLGRAGVSPNTISTWSMVFGAAAGAALAATSLCDDWQQRLLWLAAAVLVQLRLLCNLLDGMVAVSTGNSSRVGEVFNEAPDRVSDAAILIGAGYAAGGDLRLGLLAALLAVLVAYVRALGASLGAGQRFEGPMAKPQRMFVITLATLYCAAAPAAWRPRVTVDDGDWSIIAWALILISAGCLVTAARRMRNIVCYLKEQD